MGGVVIGSDTLIGKMRHEFVGLLGGILDPHAAFLIQRGLKTYLLRYEAQSASAQQVAEVLASHDKVARVHSPGLSTHPRHALARKQMRHFGTVVSFDLHAGSAAGDCFADALQLFAIVASVGSPESLVMPPGLMGVGDVPAELKHATGLAAGTVRLSIGLEDVDDLIDDIKQALALI
jgi:cystathionine beta-lyase/cystathionine gamma-synthase